MFENPTVTLSALRNSCAKITCFSSELIFKFLVRAYYDTKVNYVTLIVCSKLQIMSLVCM